MTPAFSCGPVGFALPPHSAFTPSRKVCSVGRAAGKWLFSLAELGWGFSVWKFFDDGRNPLAEFGGLMFISALLAVAHLVAMVVAGRWMKSAKPKGHYLALVALALPVVVALPVVAKSPLGINGCMLLALGFLTLTAADIRKLRSSPEFSLTVDSYRLVDFWPAPWLVTASCIGLVSGYGTGAVPAALAHLLSPIAIGYIFLKLRSNPAVRRTPQPGRYYWSLAAWVFFYAASIVIGIQFLEGLSGLAMQGAGR